MVCHYDVKECDYYIGLSLICGILALGKASCHVMRTLVWYTQRGTCGKEQRESDNKQGYE